MSCGNAPRPSTYVRDRSSTGWTRPVRAATPQSRRRERPKRDREWIARGADDELHVGIVLRDGQVKCRLGIVGELVPLRVRHDAHDRPPSLLERTCFPMADSFGHSRRANASLTTMAGVAPSRSDASNARPARTGMPSVKSSGRTMRRLASRFGARAPSASSPGSSRVSAPVPPSKGSMLAPDTASMPGSAAIRATISSVRAFRRASVLNEVNG